MVEIQTIAAANRRFSRSPEQSLQPGFLELRRVGKRHPWRKILIVPVPVGLAAVSRAGQVKRELREEGFPSQHVRQALIEKFAGAGGGRDLVASRLIGRLQQTVSKAPGQGEIGRYPPGVLHVELSLIGPEVADQRMHIRKDCA